MRKVGARMKFCEVINDFAEHMTRLEQKLFLKRTDRAYQLSSNTNVLYVDYHLVDFILNNFRPIVNSFYGNITVFKRLFKSKNEELSPFCHE